MSLNRTWMLLIGTLALVALPAVARAEMSFHVRIIEATKTDKENVDARLKSIERELQVFKKDYNTFKVSKDVHIVLHPNQTEAFTLPDNTPYRITFLGQAADKPGRVRYTVEMPGVKTTRLVAAGGRTLDAAPRKDRLFIVATTIHPHEPPAPKPKGGVCEGLVDAPRLDQSGVVR